MADPFTVAVSVAGLTSLGIQLAQGLKKYADSAIDSKGRVQAISLEIELAVQVIKTLDCPSVKKRNMAMWPTIEKKVERSRDDLEKIKLTLQILMSVMMYAKMFASTTDSEDAAQQRLEIRRLQEEERGSTCHVEISRSRGYYDA
ncbi:hypothetical protein M436DRAFT_84841 [Aureobasidium namibiae CBS 147.97]|uniref:Fungal N-terminal domain-containing protein n=1 Tax=Aureobasidium namibiae CBS 147.97 TaxID=1043004 RepID=A0A074WBC5_9PEZI